MNLNMNWVIIFAGGCFGVIVFVLFQIQKQIDVVINLLNEIMKNTKKENPNENGEWS